MQKLLRSNPDPDQQTAEVRSMHLKLKLKPAAREAPLESWYALVGAWSKGERPLHISLKNPNEAEIFYDPKATPHIESIPPSVQRVEVPILTERDVKRRARAYLAGYFKRLRHATLQGMTPQLQASILLAAEEMLEKNFRSRAVLRKQ